ncbi:hypothetical protein BDR26DRAFT_1004672 [Obelidium mucronatum]|nr:hypothetical protein BDR26DRAFT_1004672 [Obelidium mucronatum]
MARSKTLHLYPSYEGYIATIDVMTSDAPSTQTVFNNVVFLDISGSMGNNVQKVVNEILPIMFYKLRCKPTDSVKLVTFDSVSDVHHSTVARLKELPIRAKGGTYMAPGISNLEKVLLALADDHNNTLRLLTVSDGEIFDTEETLKKASVLSAWSKSRNMNVDSQAVRFMSSTYAQPDTRALCSLLQLNNSIASAVDVSSNLDAEAAGMEFANLFDSTLCACTLEIKNPTNTNHPKFKLFPWNKAGTSVIRLVEGRNVFWIDGIPSESELSVNGEPGSLQILVHDDTELSSQAYESLLYHKLSIIINQIKVLKIVNTPDAIANIATIHDYFSGLEQDLRQRDQTAQAKLDTASGSSSPTDSRNSLANRVTRLKTSITKRSRSILQELLQIANDNKVNQLNSAQQAAYLRTADLSRNSKGLAKRALNSSTGLDFDEIARQEVRAMHSHLDELTEINDSNHEKSFFSWDTTLGGIRTVCQLVDDNLLDNASANEILELLNIVGVTSTINSCLFL